MKVTITVGKRTKEVPYVLGVLMPVLITVSKYRAQP